MVVTPKARAAAIWILTGAMVAPGMAVAAAASPSPGPTPSPVFNPAVTLDITSGPVGATVHVTATGFPPNESVGVYVDDPSSFVATPARLAAGGAQTDSQGSIQVFFRMPPATFGGHQVCVDTGGSDGGASAGVKACASFDVAASVGLEPSTGVDGTQFTIRGTGFPAVEIIAITLDNQCCLGTPGPTSDGTGSFFYPGSVRQRPAGPISVCGETVAIGGGPPAVYAKACATFTLVASVGTLIVAPPSGPPGTTFSLSGSGFTAQATVQVALDAVPIVCSAGPTHAITDSNGHFATTVLLKAQVSTCAGEALHIGPGKHTFCAQTGPSVSGCASFLLEAAPASASIAPAASRLPFPLEGVVAAAVIALLVLLAGTASVVVLRRRR